jgi:hypothetical protein
MFACAGACASRDFSPGTTGQGVALGERGSVARIHATVVRGVKYRVLGPLQVLNAGTALLLGGAKLRAVLAMLLLHANEVVPADTLIESVWGEEPPANARATPCLHRHPAQDPDRATADGHERLRRQPPGYRLAAARGELDLDAFGRLAAECRAVRGSATRCDVVPLGVGAVARTGLS